MVFCMKCTRTALTLWDSNLATWNSPLECSGASDIRGHSLGRYFGLLSAHEFRVIIIGGGGHTTHKGISPLEIYAADKYLNFFFFFAGYKGKRRRPRNRASFDGGGSEKKFLYNPPSPRLSSSKNVGEEGKRRRFSPRPLIFCRIKSWVRVFLKLLTPFWLIFGHGTVSCLWDFIIFSYIRKPRAIRAHQTFRQIPFLNFSAWCILKCATK